MQGKSIRIEGVRPRHFQRRRQDVGAQKKAPGVDHGSWMRTPGGKRLIVHRKGVSSNLIDLEHLNFSQKKGPWHGS
jgi:hypothetical protein